MFLKTTDTLTMMRLMWDDIMDTFVAIDVWFVSLRKFEHNLYRKIAQNNDIIARDVASHISDEESVVIVLAQNLNSLKKTVIKTSSLVKVKLNGFWWCFCWITGFNIAGNSNIILDIAFVQTMLKFQKRNTTQNIKWHKSLDYINSY